MSPFPEKKMQALLNLRTQQEDVVREARNLVDENPSEENNISLKETSGGTQNLA